jgi:ComF family protein
MECNASSFLDGATALYDYQSSLPLAQFIKKLKYHHSAGISSSLPKIINHATFDIGKLTAIDTVCIALQPVPLHTRRERERGFNQAEKIAEAWNDVLHARGVEGSVVEKKALTRVRYTTPQAGLGALERRKNLSDAFCWDTTFSAPEQVFLIDDVITTGSTMQECARELKRQGTKWVWGLALARG